MARVRQLAVRSLAGCVGEDRGAVRWNVWILEIRTLHAGRRARGPPAQDGVASAPVNRMARGSSSGDAPAMCSRREVPWRLKRRECTGAEWGRRCRQALACRDRAGSEARCRRYWPSAAALRIRTYGGKTRNRQLTAGRRIFPPQARRLRLRPHVLCEEIFAALNSF